ncbi:MAG: hypothetical protein ACJ8IQ_10940 [Chthoniobacterales bacterium]
MAYEVYRYDDAYGSRPRRRTNWFIWSVVILLLIGMALAAWIGSFYIFWKPERPQSYRILKKLHKVEPIKRFELTAAPQGEFLNPQQLFERYSSMTPTELEQTNAELTRNFIRNYQGVRGLVPYIVGRYTIMETRGLTQNDVFTSGVVALTMAVDNGELLMEHVYPADPQAVGLMKQTLVPNLEIKLERTHDVSAVVHADRQSDGRLLITAMPLLYGTYTVTKGAGMFSLEPPSDINLEAGWPIFKEPEFKLAQQRFDERRLRNGPRSSAVAIPGLPTSTPPPAENALVRVETALPPTTAQPPAPAGRQAKNAPPPPPPGKGVKPGKGQPSPAKGAVAQKGSPAPVAPPTAAAPPPAGVPAVANGSPGALQPAPAQPLPGDALASTAGGGTWKTFPPGKMPAGRLISPTDLKEIADKGLAGERVYLGGQFVVNFAEGNRAVLRPKTGLTDRMLHFGSDSQSARVVVEFPAGYTPPAQGSTVTRDASRPYEVTEIRKDNSGQLNVFVREIIQ